MKFIIKKVFKYLVLSIIISLFLEVFICNFRSFRTLNYKKIDFSDSYCLDNNELCDNGFKKEYNEKDNYIEIKNINKTLDNSKLELNILSDDSYLIYDFYVRDEGNEKYYKLPSRYYYPGINQSKYSDLNLSGKAKSIKIVFKNKDNSDFKVSVNSISFNNNIKINISKTRVALFFFIIMCLFIFRPGSFLYKYNVNFRKKSQVCIFIGLFIFEALFMYFVINSNAIVKDLDKYYSNHYQYESLAKSLSKGKTYLDIEPSKELLKMKNPYDYSARKNIQSKSTEELFEWDQAYYKGKYYVYFGVVPVVLSYLPYYVITGQPLHNIYVIYLTCLLSVLGIFLLMKEIVKRYFPKTKLGVFILLFMIGANCTGLLYILEYPTLYNVPISFSLMFTYFGLFFWFSSIKKENISSVRVLLGSLCMALVAGCRPQLLIGSFFVIPIFWNKIFKNRQLFSKKGILQTICFVLPYIVVALLLMYYNKIRFSSPFDFGANYNLTGNDMTKRGFNINRVGLGLFYYLFQPVYVDNIFPFVREVGVTTKYMGITIWEPLYGGAIFTNLLFIFGLFYYKFKSILPKVLKNISLICIIGVFVIVILDTQMAGILFRYHSDFLIFLFLPSLFVLLSLFNSKLSSKTLLEIFLFLCFIAFSYQFFNIFFDRYLSSMIDSSTNFFFKWYYIFQWWL